MTSAELGPANRQTVLSVSLVSYKPDRIQLERTLQCLHAALVQLGQDGHEPGEVIVVDNCGVLKAQGVDLPGVILLSGHGNVGFGRGHNLALSKVTSRYHLVLNPDVEFAPDTLATGIRYLDTHTEVVLAVPRVTDGAGRPAFLCRQSPNVFDLFLRGFAPGRLRRLFARRLARNELHAAQSTGAPLMDPPVVSGCFMLFRTTALKALGGFDPRFFLYFEDYDLSRRTARQGRIACVPALNIVHHGGGAARKGWRHIWMFSRAAWTYFGIHGWQWW